MLLHLLLLLRCSNRMEAFLFCPFPQWVSLHCNNLEEGASLLSGVSFSCSLAFAAAALQQQQLLFVLLLLGRERMLLQRPLILACRTKQRARQRQRVEGATSTSY